jgi:hypothetical protein
MRLFLSIFIAVLAVLVSMPGAQGGDPFGWVDLEIDSVTWWFPRQDSIVVTGHWSVWNHTLWDTVIFADIGIELDGIVKWGEPIDVTRSLNNCHVFTSPAECTGECYFTTTPPIQFGDCEWYYTDPQDTILEGCACEKDFKQSWRIGYAGENLLTFKLDYGDIVVEPREWNNTVSVHVGTIPVEEKTWSEIKELYKNNK